MKRKGRSREYKLDFMVEKIKEVALEIFYIEKDLEESTMTVEERSLLEDKLKNASERFSFLTRDPD